jgi:hypothetical protein
VITDGTLNSGFGFAPGYVTASQTFSISGGSGSYSTSTTYQSGAGFEARIGPYLIGDEVFIDLYKSFPGSGDATVRVTVTDTISGQSTFKDYLLPVTWV